MTAIYQAWYQEISLLKLRLEAIEQEIQKLREESRVGTIEYHIENLTVESIQNGILDLGVHMGNEMDKRIQGSGGQGSAGRKTARERMLELEQNLQEVKDQIQEYGQRLQTLEEQHRLLDERLCYLEAMHP